MLALGLAFLPACSSGTEPEPAAETEAEEQEAPEEQATEEAEPEPEPEVLGAWIATNESGTEGTEHVSKVHYVVAYDEQGYEVLFHFESDYGNSETTTVWEFDDAGNPVKAVRTYTSGDETYELTSTFECDENGNIVSRTDETPLTRYNENNEPEGTEIASSTRTFEYVYVEDCSRAAYDSANLLFVS